jgi:alpha-galactosidase
LKLKPDDLKKYRTFSDWLQLMEKNYNVMSFRQDLPGFGEPMEGSWDGFQRINTETKSGGIIAVIRHGSIETKRIVTVKYLNPMKTYSIKSTDGKVISTLTGHDLQAKGFELSLDGLYSGGLFELSVR